MTMTKQYRDRGSDTPDAPSRVVKIDTAESEAAFDAAERVDIFEIDGKVYSMPKIVRAEIGLNYLRILRARGVDEATAYLMEETLGKEALTALSNVKGLTEKQFEAVQKSIRRYALPKDRGRKGAA